MLLSLKVPRMREGGLETSALTQMRGEDGTSVTHFLVCTLMCKELVPHVLSKTLAAGQTLQEAGEGSVWAGCTGV